MAGNIPGTGGSALPGPYTQVETQSTGVSVPGGTRIASIIGEGSKAEVLVSSALGGGQDGLNSTYTSTNGSDGRHFLLTQSPVVSNRTSLFRNGLPLVGLEQAISSTPFSSVYDYRIDITNGRIELQTAHLVDLGGKNYSAASTNVGVGGLSNIELLDINAPSETWTIKCVGVQRNNSNVPIAETARFVAFGSISGNVLDANGNTVVWTANDIVVSNGILKFSVEETGTPFREGDSFVIKVSSGVLNENDTLTVNYISVSNLNDPVFFQSMDDITAKHGLVTVDNNLSLGCQLAFANNASGVMCVQAAPSVPRRTSYTLDESVVAASTNPDDFIFPLPVGVVPDLNSQIHFFVRNVTTNVEKQVLPNKFTFYTLGTLGQPTVNDFIFDDVQAPAGNSFSYSVISLPATVATGYDGYVGRQPLDGYQAVFSDPNITFTADYVGRTVKIIDAVNVANKGSFVVGSVSNGDLNISATSFPDFTTATGLAFQLIDPAAGNAVLASGTDGYISAVFTGTGTCTFGSNSGSGVNFANYISLLPLTSKRIKISGTATQNGIYDITTHSVGANTVTLKKVFVTESGMRYEVLATSTGDNGLESRYVVVNHNVVPNLNALRITIVDQRDATFFDAGWINALTSLETQEIDILVPLPKQTISVIFQNALNHCKSMSSIKNKKERVLFCGAINGLTPANLTGAQPAAVEDIGVLEGIQGETVSDILAGDIEDLTNYSVPDAFGTTFRSVYFYPDQIVVQAGTDNVLLDGFYIAAAAAGYLSGIGNVAIPLTNKVLSGFTILRNKQFSTLVKEQLVNAGVTVLEPVQGGGRVVFGITTTQSGYPEEQEISIIFIRDRIAKSMRSGFTAYIGLPEDDTMTATLSARATSLLQSFISQGLITAYKNLLVQRDSVDPRQWNISVKCQPTYPVNFILIKVSLGLL